MKKNALSFGLFCIAFALFAFACTNLKNDFKKETSWSLEMKNAGCVDVCPSYSIVIDQQGQYNYNGRFNVKHKGIKSGTLNQTTLSELQSLLTTINWTELDSTYGQNNDSPRKELNYISAGINKTIVYYRMEPLEIRKLEQIIDSIIEHDKF